MPELAPFIAPPPSPAGVGWAQCKVSGVGDVSFRNVHRAHARVAVRVAAGVLRHPASVSPLGLVHTHYVNLGADHGGPLAVHLVAGRYWYVEPAVLAMASRN